MFKVLQLENISDNVSVWILRVASLRIVCFRFSLSMIHPFSTGEQVEDINIGKTLEILVSKL